MPDYYGLLKKGASQALSPQFLGMPAILRHKNGTTRKCFVVIDQYTPIERMGKLTNPIDQKALVSVKGLATKPDSENETLVTLVRGTSTENEVLRIVAPATVIAPGGVTIMYELQVRNVNGGA